MAASMAAVVLASILFTIGMAAAATTHSHDAFATLEFPHASIESAAAAATAAGRAQPAPARGKGGGGRGKGAGRGSFDNAAATGKARAAKASGGSSQKGKLSITEFARSRNYTDGAPWSVWQQPGFTRRVTNADTGASKFCCAWLELDKEFGLSNLCKQPTAHCEEYDIYQFGVWMGLSMRYITRELSSGTHRAKFRKFWGFDSFQGLPEESSSTARTDHSQSQWKAGAFNVAKFLKEPSVERIQKQIKEYVGDSRIEFVDGFYDRSLTPTLVSERGMRPALFVEIDCDLYSSSIVALEWMAANGIVVPGTIIGYDDWYSGGEGGEQRAHREIVAKYNLKLRPLSERVFEVLTGDGKKTKAAFPALSAGVETPSPTKPRKASHALTPSASTRKPSRGMNNGVVTQPEGPVEKPAGANRKKLLGKKQQADSPAAAAPRRSTKQIVREEQIPSSASAPQNALPRRKEHATPIDAVPKFGDSCPDHDPQPPGAILFVVAAHLTDSTNCGLLQQTLQSLHCYHRTQPILIVDNESPLKNLEHVLKQIHYSGIHSRIIVRRVATSVGQLGSWKIADEVLSSAADVATLSPHLHITHLHPGAPPSTLHNSSSVVVPSSLGPMHYQLASAGAVRYIVTLQHSTRLAGHVGIVDGCNAMGLGGAIARKGQNITSGTSLWMDPSIDPGMRLAAKLSRSLQIECLAPCTDANNLEIRAEKGKKPPLDWAVASHAVAIFSRSSWDALVALRLWPRFIGTAKQQLAVPAFMQQIWWAAERSDKAPEKHKKKSHLSVATINSAMERLTGILLSRLNGNPKPADKCTVHAFTRRCARDPACFHTVHGVVKTHGGTLLATAHEASCAAV